MQDIDNMNAECQKNNNTWIKLQQIKRDSYAFLFINRPIPTTTPISSHDKASQTLKPVNNIPNPTRNPRYATTCTPTRGKSAGV